MVGVPLSRGCQTCRRRKIKCDERRPACVKCTNSRLSCPGYPRRLKFMDENRHFRPKIITQQRSSEHIVVRSLPCSSTDQLAIDLYQTFRPDLPAVKSLATFSKTYFVQELPRHVGLSLACDLSMKALCLAHTSLLKPSAQNLVQSRIQYGRALAALQLCIADPERASTAGTLCATVLLGIFEQLLCADFSAYIRHAGGAARLIEASDPRQFEEPFAYRMLNSLQGAIIVESMLCRRTCFLGLPQWRRVCRSTNTPFSALFTVLSRLPNVLFEVHESESASFLVAEVDLLTQQVLLLRHDLQTWRDTPAYAEFFHTDICPIPEYPRAKLVYKSSKAVDLLCTYAAMMILINASLIRLSEGDTVLYRLENVMLAKQICQSYESSRGYSASRSLAMNFAFRAAYIVPDVQQKQWIAEKMFVMAGPLGGIFETGVTAAELESCFDYLTY